jgi:uncharacterized protein (DUF2147 family)
MLRLVRMSLITTFMGVVFLSTGASADVSPLGTWTMGKVTVKVTDCGGGICGTIVALKEPISRIDGKPKVDRENLDESKCQRPLIGLPVMMGMKPMSGDQWQGSIYNPDDGRTYNATVKLDGDTMKVQGCVASIFCKTNNFARVN